MAVPQLMHPPGLLTLLPQLMPPPGLLMLLLGQRSRPVRKEAGLLMLAPGLLHAQKRLVRSAQTDHYQGEAEELWEGSSATGVGHHQTRSPVRHPAW